MRSFFARACTGLVLIVLILPLFAPAQESAATPVAADKPAAPAPSVSVTNTLHVTVDPARILTDAKLEYRVLNGEVKSLQFAVPLGQRILDVITPDVATGQWTAAQEANRQLITVPLKTPGKNTIIVEVRTDASLKGQEATVAGVDDAVVAHGIHAVGVQSERGVIVVSHGEGIAVSVHNPAELPRVNEASVPAAARRPNAEYFRYFNTKFTLKVAIQPVEPRMTVEQFTQLGFIGYDLRLHSELKYQVDRPGVSKFAIKLPENVEIDSVGADALEDFRIDSESNVLTVKLKQTLQGAVGVSIFSRRLLKPDDFHDVKPLPLLQPMGVIRESGDVSLFASTGITVIPDNDERVGMAPTRVTSQPMFAGMRAVSAWIYSRRPIELPAKIVRKPPRVTATIGAVLEVSAERVDVNASLVYESADVASNQFRVIIPASAGEDVSIRLGAKANAAEIVETRHGEKTADGWVTWTVMTSQPVTGELPLAIHYQQSLAGETKPDAKHSITLPQAEGCEIEDAEEKSVVVVPQTFSGEVSLVAADGVSLSAVSSANTSQPIAPSELTLVAKRGELAYRYTSQPLSLMVAATPRPAAVADTTVPRAAIEVGVGSHENIFWRCRYQVVSRERQWLAVDLPKNASSITAFVDGIPTTLTKVAEYEGEQDSDRYRVNVVRDRDVDEPFVLTLSFASPAPSRIFESKSGLLYIPIPKIVDGNETAPIRQLKTQVWIPDDYSFVSTPKYFVAEEPSVDLDEWVGGSTRAAGDFPVSGHPYAYRSLDGNQPLEFRWWDMPFYTRILSGALIVIALVLCGTSWRNRLAVLAVGALAFIAFAMNNPDTARYALMAARYGLVGIAAVWAVPPLYRKGRSTTRRENQAAASNAPTNGLVQPNPPTN